MSVFDSKIPPRTWNTFWTSVFDSKIPPGSILRDQRCPVLGSHIAWKSAPKMCVSCLHWKNVLYDLVVPSLVVDVLYDLVVPSLIIDVLYDLVVPSLIIDKSDPLQGLGVVHRHWEALFESIVHEKATNNGTKAANKRTHTQKHIPRNSIILCFQYHIIHLI